MNSFLIKVFFTLVYVLYKVFVFFIKNYKLCWCIFCSFLKNLFNFCLLLIKYVFSKIFLIILYIYIYSGFFFIGRLLYILLKPGILVCKCIFYIYYYGPHKLLLFCFSLLKAVVFCFLNFLFVIFVIGLRRSIFYILQFFFRLISLPIKILIYYKSKFLYLLKNIDLFLVLFFKKFLYLVKILLVWSFRAVFFVFMTVNKLGFLLVKILWLILFVPIRLVFFFTRTLAWFFIGAFVCLMKSIYYSFISVRVSLEYAYEFVFYLKNFFLTLFIFFYSAVFTIFLLLKNLIIQGIIKVKEKLNKFYFLFNFKKSGFSLKFCFKSTGYGVKLPVIKQLYKIFYFFLIKLPVLILNFVISSGMAFFFMFYLVRKLLGNIIPFIEENKNLYKRKSQEYGEKLLRILLYLKSTLKNMPYWPYRLYKFMIRLEGYDVMLGMVAVANFITKIYILVVFFDFRSKFIFLFKILKVFLWPVFVILRIVYIPFSPVGDRILNIFSVVYGKFIDMLSYRLWFNKRTPIPDQNKKEEINVKKNMEQLVRNTNTVLVNILNDTLGESVREFMFDPTLPTEYFRSDFDFYDRDMFSLNFLVQPGEVTGQVDADFRAIYVMFKTENLIKEERHGGYDLEHGSAFSRKSFSFRVFFKKLFSGRNFGKEGVRPFGLPIYGGLDFARINLRKRITFFKKYYNFLSRRFDLFLKGHIKSMDQTSLKEEAKREKVFSKKYKRRHTFKDRLIYDIEKPGFLRLTPTFLSKVDELLKKDISSFFVFYGDSQFRLQNRFSNLTLMRGLVSLACLFFLVAYILVPQEELILYYKCLCFTVVAISAGLSFIYYFSLLKRRDGIFSKKSNFVDNDFVTLIQIISAVILFFICLVFLLYYEIFMNLWSNMDIGYINHIFSNETVMLDWLINSLSETLFLDFDDYLSPLFSSIERSQLINQSVWNGQFYNPASLLYMSDYFTLRFTFFDYLLNHYAFLLRNVHSPIIAIIGETCGILRERYMLEGVLPTSFTIQDYLLDIKYRVIFENFRKLDIRLFKFLQEILREDVYKILCDFLNVVAWWTAHLMFSFLILFNLNLGDWTIPYENVVMLKKAQFYPQIEKLELDTLDTSIQTVYSGNLINDILYSVSYGEDINNGFVSFNYRYLLSGVFNYIFKFFFFDLYAFLGFPMRGHLNIYDYFNKEVIGWKWSSARFTTPPSEIREVSPQDNLYDESGYKNYFYLISDHNLLDPYETYKRRDHTPSSIGEDYLKKCRFALSPPLREKFVYSQELDDYWVDNVIASYFLFKIQSSLRFLVDYYLSCYPSMPVIYSKFSYEIQSRAHAHRNEFFNGFEKMSKCVFCWHDVDFLKFLSENLIHLKAVNAPGNLFYFSNVAGSYHLTTTQHLGNNESFMMFFRSPKWYYNLYSSRSIYPINCFSYPKELLWFMYHPTEAAKQFGENYILFKNWNNEEIFESEADFESLRNFCILKSKELEIRDNYGGVSKFSNVLNFYYSSIAKCAYNENFFKNRYNYPLLIEDSCDFKNYCLIEHIKSNLLLNDKFNFECGQLLRFGRLGAQYYRYFLNDCEEDFGKDAKSRQLYKNIIEVPQKPVDDMRHTLKYLNAFDKVITHMALNDNTEDSDNLYMRVCIGDILYCNKNIISDFGKFQFFFPYYKIQRGGIDFIIPIMVDLSQNVAFNTMYLSDYNREFTVEKEHALIRADELYFKELDDFSITQNWVDKFFPDPNDPYARLRTLTIRERMLNLILPENMQVKGKPNVPKPKLETKVVGDPVMFSDVKKMDIISSFPKNFQEILGFVNIHPYGMYLLGYPGYNQDRSLLYGFISKIENAWWDLIDDLESSGNDYILDDYTTKWFNKLILQLTEYNQFTINFIETFEPYKLDIIDYNYLRWVDVYEFFSLNSVDVIKSHNIKLYKDELVNILQKEEKYIRHDEEFGLYKIFSNNFNKFFNECLSYGYFMEVRRLKGFNNKFINYTEPLREFFNVLS